MDAEFMQIAIALSIENVRSGRGGPFGAVIAKGREIIATGANQVTSANDPTAHAEIVAIRAACQKLQDFQLSGCDLYTSCEPCPMCLGAIYWARPDQVYYASSREDAASAGFDDEFIYSQITLPVDRRKIPMRQALQQEAEAAFRAWEEMLHKIRY
ncbi:nucleoside deaminase [Nevskia soli]|jgi:tRNA(Arg) A34 adenosine deaminase TadA|uniref:nucleoside deaminase n=1 Tax=Nevskia soli TaxID=418856 RepID=UPI0015D90D12|nr:nucleoside deaminase [Nevskia soli]